MESSLVRESNGTRSDLRRFGMTLGGALVFWAAVFWWRGRPWYPYFLAAGMAMPLVGLMLPTLLKPLHRAWLGVAWLVGWALTRIVLGAVFYLGLTPVGLLLRLTKKDLLDQKLDRNAESYWVAKEARPFDRSTYEKQF